MTGAKDKLWKTPVFLLSFVSDRSTSLPWSRTTCISCVKSSFVSSDPGSHTPSKGIFKEEPKWLRWTNDINVTDVQFLGQRGDSDGQEPAPAPEEYQEPGTDVDLPF